MSPGLRATLRKRLSSSEGVLDITLDLRIDPGGRHALFGPSGCGKSSILRMLAGLMTPDEGRIELDGQVWFDSAARIDQPPHRRRPGLVFQDHALFPHRSALQNIMDGLAPGPSRKAEASALLARFELQGVADHLPRLLSGGQKQRVALARTLASAPPLLLLDEPLSALDAALRGRMLEEISTQVRDFEGPLLLVSHDLSEVWRLANHVHVLERGSIARAGSPEDVFAPGRSSPRLRIPGTVLDLVPSDGLFVLTASAGGEVVRAVVSAQEAARLRPGSPVLLAAKAFETLVLPLED